MSKWLRGSLVPLSAFVLLLPPAWCCQIPEGVIGGEDETSAEDAPAAPLHGCCCTSRLPAPQTPVPAPEAPPPPNKSCCCERLPTDRPKPSSPLTELLAGDVPGPIDPCRTPPRSVSRAVAAETSPSVGIHVLHCVWLC